VIEEGIEGPRKGGRRRGKHPQITQISQIRNEEEIKRRGNEEKRIYMDGWGLPDKNLMRRRAANEHE